MNNSLARTSAGMTEEGSAASPSGVPCLASQVRQCINLKMCSTCSTVGIQGLGQELGSFPLQVSSFLGMAALGKRGLAC